MENFEKERNGYLIWQSMQKVNLTCWSLQPSPKEQPQDKNKIINETREDCVLNRPMVDKENHVCSMGHKIAFIL